MQPTFTAKTRREGEPLGIAVATTHAAPDTHAAVLLAAAAFLADTLHGRFRPMDVTVYAASGVTYTADPRGQGYDKKLPEGYVLGVYTVRQDKSGLHVTACKIGAEDMTPQRRPRIPRDIDPYMARFDLVDDGDSDEEEECDTCRYMGNFCPVHGEEDGHGDDCRTLGRPDLA